MQNSCSAAEYSRQEFRTGLLQKDGKLGFDFPNCKTEGTDGICEQSGVKRHGLSGIVEEKCLVVMIQQMLRLVRFVYFSFSYEYIV